MYEMEGPRPALAARACRLLGRRSPGVRPAGRPPPARTPPGIRSPGSRPFPGSPPDPRSVVS